MSAPIDNENVPPGSGAAHGSAAAFGARARCRMCGDAIRYTGKYWEHLGRTPRHPATPPDPKTCDHKFVDSKWCLKCGWVPPP